MTNLHVHFDGSNGDPARMVRAEPRLKPEADGSQEGSLRVLEPNQAGKVVKETDDMTCFGLSRV